MDHINWKGVYKFQPIKFTCLIYICPIKKMSNTKIRNPMMCALESEFRSRTECWKSNWYWLMQPIEPRQQGPQYHPDFLSPLWVNKVTGLPSWHESTPSGKISHYDSRQARQQTAFHTEPLPRAVFRVRQSTGSSSHLETSLVYKRGLGIRSFAHRAGIRAMLGKRQGQQEQQCTVPSDKKS